MPADVQLLAGRHERFAIEAEIEEEVDGWVLGHFRFWLCGRSVGNWSDTADLRGCVRWLRDFANVRRDRCLPELYVATADEVFRQLHDPVMAVSDRPVTDEPAPDRSAPIDRAFERFHISHLGMSSFDTINMLLLQDAAGSQRCLWQQAESP